MQKKSPVQRPRWTLSCPEKIGRPKSPDLLPRVLGHLGPFAHETRAQAVESGDYFEHHRRRFGISQELALQFVVDAAWRFNEEEYLAHAAPRFKHVVERLKETQRLADELASHLESLDDITRHELQNAGTPESQGQFRALMEAADAQALPRPSTDNNDGVGSWVDRLRSLSSYAGATSVNLVSWRSKHDLAVTDRGGNTNLWKEAKGRPRWGLVTDAIDIFERFKPGEATATELGPLHSFIGDLFEYATGREGAEYAKVDDWLKKLVPAHREDKRLEQREAKLESACDEIILRDPAARTEADLKRLTEMEMALGEIALKRRDLWRIMWPHVRLPR